MRNRYQYNHFFFKAYRKIKQLLKKGHIVCIQEPKLTENQAKLINIHLKAHISSEAHGLITLIPENVDIISKEVKQLGRVQITTVIINKVKHCVFNIYAPTTKNQKIKRQFFNELNTSIEEAAEWNVNAKIIIGGDFNIDLDAKSTARTELFNTISKAQLLDAYRHRYHTAKGFTRFPSINQKGNPVRMDGFFIPADQGKLRFSRFDIPKTDHKLCTLEIFPNNDKTAKLKPMKTPTFHKSLLEDPTHIKNLTNIIMNSKDTPNKESNYNNLIYSLMKYSKEETKKATSPQDARIIKLTKLVNDAESKYSTLNKNQRKKYLINMQNLRTQLELKEVKLNKMRDTSFQHYGEAGTKQFLKSVKQKSKSQIMTQLAIDNKIITDSNKIAEHMVEYYRNVFQDNGRTGKHFTDLKGLEIFKNRISHSDNQNIIGNIKQYELDIGMGHLNKEATPGADGVTLDLLQFIYKTKPTIILDFLNALIRYGSDTAFQITYKILKKPGKRHYNTPANYRPIALMKISTRLLDKILLNRITPIIEKANIPTFQHNLAYKKQKSPNDVLALLMDALDLIKKHNIKNAVILSIDFAKAFDSLNHNYVLDFLSYIGLPKNITAFMRKRFQNTQGFLKDYQVDSNFFCIKKGIPQGSALSGYIFILCLAPLLHLIEESSRIKQIEIDLHYLGSKNKISIPKVSAFADDLNIIMTVNEQNGVIPEIEELKHIFKLFEEISSLAVNLDKTFSFSSTESNLLEYIEKKYKIKNESKNNIRLLGHLFCPSNHMDSKTVIAKIKQNIITSIAGLRSVPTQGRYILTNTFITSQINFHITQINKIYKRDVEETQRIVNRFIKSPFSNTAKYKPLDKGGAAVPNIYNIIEAGKVASYKSYIHSKYCYKVHLREVIKSLGFNLTDMLNVGIKLQNLFLNLLDKIGLSRLAIITKKTFDIIGQTRPHHIPILGNEADPNLPKNPKSLSSLKYRSGEFTFRNPLFKPLTNIRDLRNIVINQFAHKIQYKTNIPSNKINEIDDSLIVVPPRDLSNLCGKSLSMSEYNKICQKLKQIITNLKTKNKNFMELFLKEPDNNTLILAIESGNKKTNRLAIRAQQINYDQGTLRTARKFNKEGILLQPNDLAKATSAAFKLKVGPKIRNYSFKYTTRSLITEHRLAKIQKRDENLCKYNGERITLGHYYMYPLTAWLQNQLEKALLINLQL